ncbi:hypothetical protein ACROYT_G012860 [Oculina patagonica]
MADAKKICSSIGFTCFAALLIRICLIAYGEWQDKNMVVKYTDIDYRVFTDAARHVVEGNSPYLRATYRYTPLLSVLLTPNITLHMCFGKVLFVFFDVLAGYLLYKILCVRRCSDQRAVIASWLWLFNPLPLTVSTRGNAESIMAVLVLASIYFVLVKNVPLTAIFFALSVHFKIFPIIYGLPLVLLVGDDAYNSKKTNVSKSENKNKSTGFIYQAVAFILHPQRVKFAMISAVTFLGLTGLLYIRYGFEFLEHTYLYHVTRQDVKHNFSVYFYMMYLVEGSGWASVLGLASFIPQLVLAVTFGIVYYRDIPFCCFVQTFAFVAFNKVCTSQYFLWYLCLLPLIVDSVNIRLQKVIVLTAAWFAGQALWLTAAYYLEFEGMNTFVFVWAAGVVFFIVNIVILNQLVRNYKMKPVVNKAD